MYRRAECPDCKQLLSWRKVAEYWHLPNKMAYFHTKHTGTSMECHSRCLVTGSDKPVLNPINERKIK